MPESDSDEDPPFIPPMMAWSIPMHYSEEVMEPEQIPLEGRKVYGRPRKMLYGPFKIASRSCGDFHDVVIEHEDGWSVVVTEAGATNLSAGYTTIYNPPKEFEVYLEFVDRETGKPRKQIRMKEY